MDDNLRIRLHAYATTAEARAPVAAARFTEAIASSRAASAAASATLICSHPRELRGESEPGSLLPGQDELDVLSEDKAPVSWPRLALRPGIDGLAAILSPLQPRGPEATPAQATASAITDETP